MKIAICGLLTSENLGEWFIADSLKYLLERELGKRFKNVDVEYKYIDILANTLSFTYHKNPIKRRMANNYGYNLLGLPFEVLDFFLKKIAQKKNIKIVHIIRHLIWTNTINYKPRFWKYYSEKFNDVDLIVVDGAGLLEYSANEYFEPLYLISLYGEKKGIPIAYNAIGASGEFDSNDFRCTILKKALSSSAVKYISARDSVDIVQKCAGKNHQVALKADAAFWAAETYEVKKELESNVVGIGLIRGDSLKRYNVQFGEEKWLDLFESIARELEKRKYSYFFFTNGMSADYRLGELLLKRMNLPGDKLISKPHDTKELIETIARCNGLITCRMHSSIVATSMGITSIVLSWNKKIDKYFDILGYSERAIHIDSFTNVPYIVDEFEKALSIGIGSKSIKKMKMLSEESVEELIDSIVEAKRE